MVGSFGLSFRRFSKDIIVLLVGRLIGNDFLTVEQFKKGYEILRNTTNRLTIDFFLNQRNLN